MHSIFILMTNSLNYRSGRMPQGTVANCVDGRLSGRPMQHLLATLKAAMLASLCALSAGANASDQSPFIPETFEPPVYVIGDGFVLKPLGPELVEVDYVAYMSSIEHLRTTFSLGNWPREDINMDDAMLDMENEARRFAERSSFAYAVLTKDEQTELGCVYVYPSKKAGYDAMVRLWVTQAEFDKGFDAELFAWTKEWVAASWPFANPAYPGRLPAWDEWNKLPDLE